jgi:hypothetical protein
MSSSGEEARERLLESFEYSAEEDDGEEEEADEEAEDVDEEEHEEEGAGEDIGTYRLHEFYEHSSINRAGI